MKQSESVPKTANLLACKQWWKVCFLHGDQEKYYRQIYGRAAAQRLAKSPNNDDKSVLSSTDSRIIFPTKLHSPVVIETRSHDALKLADYRNRSDSFVPGRSDPFIFSRVAVNENGSDSGIDASSAKENVRIAKSNNVGSQEM